MRTIAIVSMTLGHISNYSFLWLIRHPFMSLSDGASLFVVVVGVVYRRRIAQQGFAWSASKLAKRAGLLYLALVALALTIAHTRISPGADQFARPRVENLSTALAWVLVLGASPIYVNFLSLYAVLLFAVIPVLYLLVKGRLRLLIASLALVYVAGIVWPGFFTLPSGPTASAEINFATWFVLFVSEFWAGWAWCEKAIGDRLGAPMTVWLLGALLLVLAAFAITTTFCDVSTADWWRVKGLMAPLRFLLALMFFVACYWLIRLIDRIPRGQVLTN